MGRWPASRQTFTPATLILLTIDPHVQLLMRMGVRCRGVRAAGRCSAIIVRRRLLGLVTSDNGLLALGNCKIARDAASPPGYCTPHHFTHTYRPRLGPLPSRSSYCVSQARTAYAERQDDSPLFRAGYCDCGSWKITLETAPQALVARNRVPLHAASREAFNANRNAQLPLCKRYIALPARQGR